MNWITLFFLGLATSVVFVFTTKLCEKTAHNYYNRRLEQKKTTPKVYDIFHKYLPDYSGMQTLKYISDFFVVSLSLVPFIISKNTSAFKEYVVLYCVIVLLRSVFINLTILPKNKNCNNNECKNLIHSCYDKVFSGHFATLFLASLIFYRYSIITDKLFLILTNLVNTLMILSLRSHYTVDIAVSAIVSLLLFTNSNKFILV